jgi:CTP:molybdopterin cytidylyltransferase MocA
MLLMSSGGEEAVWIAAGHGTRFGRGKMLEYGIEHRNQRSPNVL